MALWKVAEVNWASWSGFEMKPSSTTTAGMLAPTSTRNGACWSPRGLIGTRWPSSSATAWAHRAEWSTCLSCAISHGNIFLQVTSEKEVIQPPPLAPAAATTTTVNRDTVKVTENGGGLNVFAEMPTVQEVARALNSLGATPRDMMAIFQELKTAKALQAELIVK